MAKHLIALGTLAAASLSYAGWNPFQTPAESPADTPTLGQTLQQSKLQFKASPNDSSLWQAPQETFGYTAELNREGLLHVKPIGEGEGLRVRLASVGRGERRDFQSEPYYSGFNRDIKGWPLMEFHRGSIDEWYVNKPGGLHHWFEIKQRPTSFAPGPVVIDLQVYGGQGAYSISDDAVGFEGTGLIYHGLRAWDANGRELDTRMDATQYGVSLYVEDAGAAYPITVDPAWEQVSKVQGSPTPSQLGSVVDIDGPRAVVGAPNSNRAFVYVRTDGVWVQEAALQGSDILSGDAFGRSVAIEGDTIVVGAPNHDIGARDRAGAAYVFTRSGSTWTQRTKITLPLESTYNEFGSAAAMDGTTVLITAFFDSVIPTDNDGGAVFAYTGSGATWTQQARLSGTEAGPGSRFGGSLDIQGNTAAIGASLNGELAGSAYVFTRSGSTWTQQVKLDGNGGLLDEFGYSVALDGTLLLVGEPGRDVGGTDTGMVYVYENDGTWDLVDTLTASAPANGDAFGRSVALNGTKIFVGTPGGNVGPLNDAGRLYEFEDEGSGWTEQVIHTAADAAAGATFGAAAAMNGDSIVVGAPLASGGGAAYIFSFVPTIATLTTDSVVIGGNGGEGSITVDQTQTFDTIVTLESSNPATLQVPDHVVIEAGTTSADFTFTTSDIGASETITITAASGAGEETSNVLVLEGPPQLDTISANLAMFPWYDESVGTVTLDRPAPVGGTTVSLLSTSFRGIVPASVSFDEGETSATFPITSGLVDPDQAWNFRVKAQLDSQEIETTLTILPARIKSVGFRFNPTRFGSSSLMVIYTKWAAPPGGWEIELSSSNPGLVGVPATVVVPAGQAYVTLPLPIGAGVAPSFVDIDATLGIHTVTTRLFINP